MIHPSLVRPPQGLIPVADILQGQVLAQTIQGQNEVEMRIKDLNGTNAGEMIIGDSIMVVKARKQDSSVSDATVRGRSHSSDDLCKMIIKMSW